MEMAMLQASRELLKELEAMGFPEATAMEALRYLGNANLETAIDWLINGGNGLNIDKTTPRVLMDLEIGSPGPDFITEEMNTKARALRDRAAKSRNGDRILDLQRNKEKDRIRASKELAEVRRVAEEKERARYLTAKKAEKEEERRARERILQKLENDKSPVGYSSSEADRMRECLRSLKHNPKGDDGTVLRAYQTLLKIIANVVRNPDEDKFRTIRLANPVFQDQVGSFDEGLEFLLMCGFEITEDGEFLHLPRNRVDNGLLNTAGLQLKSASTNPFFGLLERQN